MLFLGKPKEVQVVEVVDVTVNKPFKDDVCHLFEDHPDKHLELYVEGKLSGSQQRILMTKWVGRAWKKISGMKESIIKSFKKCGMSVALGGSENAQVSIDGIPNYEMSQRFVEEEFKLLDKDEDEELRMRMKMQVKTMKTTNLTF